MSHNTLIHKIARVTIVRALVGTTVKPNHLTTARLTFGVLAAGMLAVGDPYWSEIGAGVFVFALFLDRADGDYARLTGQTSALGHTYDLIADAISNALIFVGLGVGLRASEYGWHAVPMGIAAGLAVGSILWLVIRIEELEGERAAELGNFAGFDPDDAILIVPIVIWLGGAHGLLMAATIGAPAFAVFFYWLFRRKLISTQQVHRQ